MRDLIVSEVFGPTVQGEGPTAGMPTMFLRLGLCNLSCSWCDTPYTWDWTGKNGPPQDRGALKHLPVDNVLWALSLPGVRRLVITGGEPLIQGEGVAEVARRFDGHVEVETNGTLVPPFGMRGVRWNVSPKLPGAGMNPERCIVPDVLAVFAAWALDGDDVTFKFVVCDDADVLAVEYLVERHALTNVVVMPEGRNADVILKGARWLAPIAIAHGWSLSTRLHVLLWGDERGR